jgi:hypothetical protein
MGDAPTLLGPTPQPGQRKIRLFTDIATPDGRGKQFFDVPLGPDGWAVDQWGRPVVNQLCQPVPATGWQLFMTNLLQHRGFLLNNAWIPERVITLIVLDPDEQVMDPSKWDPEKVVQLRPAT